MSAEEFTTIIGLCQFLPGPNVGNASIVLGKRWFGLKGSIVAFLGFFGLPFIWVIVLASLYAEVASNPGVKAVVVGVAAAGAGLFIGTAIKLGKALVQKPAALVLVAGCFLAIGVARLPMLAVMAVAGAIALFAARRGWL